MGAYDGAAAAFTSATEAAARADAPAPRAVDTLKAAAAGKQVRPVQVGCLSLQVSGPGTHGATGSRAAAGAAEAALA